LCGLVPGGGRFAPSAAAFRILWRDIASEPSTATIVAPCSGSHPHSNATRGASAEISVRILSAGTGANGVGACVSSLEGGFALDLCVVSEDVGWGPWEVVLPAAQVPEGLVTSGAPLHRALSAATPDYTSCASNGQRMCLPCSRVSKHTCLGDLVFRGNLSASRLQGCHSPPRCRGGLAPPGPPNWPTSSPPLTARQITFLESLFSSC